MAYFTASCDSVDENTRFAKSLDLDYPILSDPEKATARQFGVVDDGRPLPRRWTFFIGKDGKLLAIEKKVDAGGHGPQIAKTLAELGVEAAQ